MIPSPDSPAFLAAFAAFFAFFSLVVSFGWFFVSVLFSMFAHGDPFVVRPRPSRICTQFAERALSIRRPQKRASGHLTWPLLSRSLAVNAGRLLVPSAFAGLRQVAPSGALEVELASGRGGSTSEIIEEPKRMEAAGTMQKPIRRIRRSRQVRRRYRHQCPHGQSRAGEEPNRRQSTRWSCAGTRPSGKTMHYCVLMPAPTHQSGTSLQ